MEDRLTKSLAIRQQAPPLLDKKRKEKPIAHPRPHRIKSLREQVRLIKRTL